MRKKQINTEKRSPEIRVNELLWASVKWDGKNTVYWLADARSAGASWKLTLIHAIKNEKKNST